MFKIQTMDISTIIGKKYGKWTVIREQGTTTTYDEKSGWHRTKQRVWCKCDCGTEKEVSVQAIIHGRSLSCGCIHKDNPNRKTHGLSHSVEHNTWTTIRNRCYNKNEPSYKYYGAKGIVMCDEWKDNFMQFFIDMGKRPADKQSIDRIDSKGNYCKENCRWATQKEQNNNKKSNVLVTYNGKTQNIAQWAEETGLSYNTLYFRLVRDKLPIEEAFSKRYNSKTAAGLKNRKLNKDQVEEIYTTSIPSKELATKYNVEVSTIILIRANKAYIDITKNLIKGTKPKRTKK